MAESQNSEKKDAAIAMQRHSEHVSTATNKHATMEKPWKQCLLCSSCQCYTARTIPELLHSKIWPSVLHDSELRMTVLMTASTNLPDRQSKVDSRRSSFQLAVLSCIVNSPYLMMTREQTEVLMCAVVVVIYRAQINRTVTVIPVMSYERSINPTVHPNPHV
jgi:hypothetical protein